MEKRIKALYIITIIAILAFLTMQVYWLYGRYEYSLNEYEISGYKEIVQAVTEVNQARKDSSDSAKGPRTFQSSYNINNDTDNTGKTRISATITSQKYYAHELLGIKGTRQLTEEEKRRVARMVLENEALVETRKQSYNVSNAPSDAAIWGAFKNADAEFISPLRAEYMDSILTAKGLESDVDLIVTDSMEWTPAVIRHASALHPTAVISVPYSELEKKSMVVSYHLPVAKIFHDMLGSLIIVILLSIFLIVCLILQFATILKLSRLDKMRNSFITTMIHELKRPISTLKMCVSGLENEKMMSNRDIKREMLSETRIALDNLSAYFSKLRDITFNNVEQIPLNLQNVNLHDIFDAVTSAINFPADKKVVINNRIDQEIEVSADRSHLYNIVNNLVENAVKYSGPEVEINASALQSDGTVELHISDTGNGIPSGDLRHIFKRFYRGEASKGEQPGMGLGLTYVKLLIDAHGGEISVESKEREGTCFIIKLPQ